MGDDIWCRIDILDDENVEYSDYYFPNVKVRGRVRIDALARKTVERLRYWIEKYGDTYLEGCKGEDLVVLGWHLYHLLFDAEPEDKLNQRANVRQAFETTYGLFEKQKRNRPDLRLRIKLTFHKQAQELADYPWEFIFAPHLSGGFFLAGKKTELILTRFVPETGVAEKLDPEERPLKVLVAFSYPRELGTVDAEAIKRYIDKLSAEGHVKVEYLENPTYKQLETAIPALEPHIFHFIGHGKEAQIALRRETEEMNIEEAEFTPQDIREGRRVAEADWRLSKSFAALFAEHQPRLVFLHACKGAATGTAYNFRSTALELVYARIPAVVAMQYPISNEDADIFATKFYEHIGEGKSIDEAVSEGRWLLGTYRAARDAWSDRAFGTPVIYLQSEGALIAPKPPTGSQEATATDKQIEHSQPPPSKVPCPYSDDLDGMVNPKRHFCPKCRRPIMPCPQCGQVMATSVGFCDNCSYSADSISSEARAEGFRGTTAYAPQSSINVGPTGAQPASYLNAPEERGGSSQIDIRAGGGFNGPPDITQESELES